MGLLVIPVLTSLAIGAIIIILFIVTNPLDEPLTVVDYPYTISVKPHTLEVSGLTHIFLSAYSNASSEVNMNGISLLLTQPTGGIIKKEFTSTNSAANLTFPRDFPNLQPSPGKYSILLLHNGINQNITASFDVLSYPPLISSLFSFSIGAGQALTIGLLISVVTAIYQFYSTRNEDRRRSQENQATWIRDHGAQYMWLQSNAYPITEYFESEETSNGYNVVYKKSKRGEEKRLLYDILGFYKAYVSFYESGLGYNVRDFLSENFMVGVWTEINGIYSEILKSSKVPLSQNQIKGADYLKKFFKDSSGKDMDYFDLEGNREFSTYATYLSNWLQKPGNDPTYPNAKKMYSYHYVYSYALTLLIYELLLASYDNPKKVEKQIIDTFEPLSIELSEYIEYLNHKFNGDNRELYFKVKFNNKDIIQHRYTWFQKLSSCLQKLSSCLKSKIKCSN